MNIIWRRILAFVIDVLVFGIVAVFSFFVVAFFVFRCNMDEKSLFDLWSNLILLLFIFRDSIRIGFGKKVMGLVVKSTKIDDRSQRELKGGTAGWRKMLLRNITLLIWPIELLMLLTNEKRLGDMLAKTIVTRMDENCKQ